MEKQRRAYIYACIAVLSWSTIASAFKIALNYLDVLSLLFFASTVSTIALFLYLVFSQKLNLVAGLLREDYLHSALLGFLNPFLYYIILIEAYDILRAQEAMTINWVWPVILVLLSIPLLGQKIRAGSILAVFISFGGVFIIATRGDILDFRLSNPLGVLLALGSTIIWALFWIYNVKDKRDEAVRLFLNFSFGSVYAFLVFLSKVFSKGIETPNFKGMAGAIYIGLFEMGVTFLVWLKALKLAKTSAHVANLVFLVPFLSLIVLHFVVAEEISFSTIVGLILIVLGITIQKLCG